MLKNYACLDYDGQVQQTHYRFSGSGAPLILLHPSPLSSAFMAPLIKLFEGLATVLAPDTPGYGASDPLSEPGEDLSAYVDWLRRFLQSQDLSSAGIYGSATGAQIAIQFARTYPEMADYIVLDNAVHFTDAERQRIMKDYFPDMTPRSDGSHFQLAWDMSSKLYQYFPWFDQSDDCKVSDASPPVELVHGTAMSYLVAGTDYDRAYRAAFNNEDARNVQAITKPTRILRWQGSILRRYADRLDDFEWPDHIRMVHCEASIEARYEALTNIIAELATN
jgi:pimeloyl-ACP methyl ester carboxylesterase